MAARASIWRYRLISHITIYDTGTDLNITGLNCITYLRDLLTFPYLNRKVIFLTRFLNSMES